MISYLPMYDWPETKSQTDAFWSVLHGELQKHEIDAPPELTRETNGEDLWLSPELLLSQTCGYPLATSLKGKVRYVATPVYDVEGCQRSTYSSAIIAHKSNSLSIDTIKGSTLAFSSMESWSGNKTLVEKFGVLADFFGSLEQSGGHRQSASMVARGYADVAAIDAVCWNFLLQYEPATTKDLKVIGWTKPRPALPFITSIQTSLETLSVLRTCLNKVLSANESFNKTLKFTGCEVLDEENYWTMGVV